MSVLMSQLKKSRQREMNVRQTYYKTNPKKLREYFKGVRSPKRSEDKNIKTALDWSIDQIREMQRE